MRAVLLQLQFFAHAPATSPGSLNNKHIVLIKMWANAATGYGEGDHQIVNPPVRQFAKRTHQRGGGFMPVIDRLYQQRPVVLAEMIIAFERTVANLPFTVWWLTSRLSTSLSIASPASSSGESGSIKLLNPRFKTTGRFCQWRSRKSGQLSVSWYSIMSIPQAGICNRL